jgi:crotonobetainyl-CoA:carnitine CoA-transferase CaiB-like acyl-CoA transferase
MSSAKAAGPIPRQQAGHLPGMLDGLRVVEIADETAEYVGMALAGLGAEVVKVEPPAGAATRHIGPFLDDKPGPDRSLHFWAYNRGKRSVALDLATDAQRFQALLASADIVLDASGGAVAKALGTTPAGLAARLPGTIVARMTPFGDAGPWKDYKSSDLVHLALGGIMMNCGYDPDPSLHYDMPPIAPQLWHAYHIAGDQMVVGILAALSHRLHTGEGQDICVAIHEAVSKNTELDVMSWVMRRAPLFRQTCRHAIEKPSHVPSIGHTKDGRWYIATGVSVRDQTNLVPFLTSYGMQADLGMPDPAADTKARNVPGSGASDEAKAHILEIVQRFIRSHRYDTMPWREAQAAGLLWAPLRKPHENVADAHWQARGTFAEIEHPEQGRSYHYPVSRWLSTETAWKAGRRAPLPGEDTEAVLASLKPRAPLTAPARPRAAAPPRLSPQDKPFPLQGVRIFDFSWFLASAGGTRFAAALGADVIKVEWKDNPDTRLAAMSPVGGREARRAATAPLKGVTDPDMGGQFNNKNSGKSGISLNIRHPKGMEIARRLIAQSDVVAEGFSPGVLQRLGLGYDALCALRPDIIYVQQSGMGGVGTYGRFRTIGPVAAAFAGTSEMSGMPEPAMPAGWGYSFLDWIGAYSFATAITGALYHRDRTGRGQWIDSSQCESGIFLKGVPILDWSANGRVWNRIGNRSPYKPAAPHGAYRCAGEDRWIAIAVFDEASWQALARTARRPDWLADPRFATLESRLLHQDALDAAITEWTRDQDAHACMEVLQQAGVPAGVCQNAEDRCERDPQLAALDWFTEVTGTKIGRWPVTEIPARMSATPPYSGGIIDRGAPGYGEDNARILGDLLGYSSAEVAALADEGVI